MGNGIYTISDVSKILRLPYQKAYRWVMELSKILNTKYPFAQKEILLNINTDGRKVYFYFRGSFLSLDGTKQFNLGFIDQFFKNLEFDQDLIASKFWPMGKQNSIVLDPKRQLGQPVINETNIQPQVLFTLFKGGEPIPFIAYLYGINEKSVKDAIDFCNPAA